MLEWFYTFGDLTMKTDYFIKRYDYLRNIFTLGQLTWILENIDWENFPYLSVNQHTKESALIETIFVLVKNHELQEVDLIREICFSRIQEVLSIPKKEGFSFVETVEKHLKILGIENNGRCSLVDLLVETLFMSYEDPGDEQQIFNLGISKQFNNEILQRLEDFKAKSDFIEVMDTCSQKIYEASEMIKQKYRMHKVLILQHKLNLDLSRIDIAPLDSCQFDEYTILLTKLRFRDVDIRDIKPNSPFESFCLALEKLNYLVFDKLKKNFFALTKKGEVLLSHRASVYIRETKDTVDYENLPSTWVNEFLDAHENEPPTPKKVFINPPLLEQLVIEARNRKLSDFEAYLQETTISMFYSATDILKAEFLDIIQKYFRHILPQIDVKGIFDNSRSSKLRNIACDATFHP